MMTNGRCSIFKIDLPTYVFSHLHTTLAPDYTPPERTTITLYQLVTTITALFHARSDGLERAGSTHGG
jgi:hypothetical protein